MLFKRSISVSLKISLGKEHLTRGTEVNSKEKSISVEVRVQKFRYARELTKWLCGVSELNFPTLQWNPDFSNPRFLKNPDNSNQKSFLLDLLHCNFTPDITNSRFLEPIFVPLEVREIGIPPYYVILHRSFHAKQKSISALVNDDS